MASKKLFPDNIFDAPKTAKKNSVFFPVKNRTIKDVLDHRKLEYDVEEQPNEDDHFKYFFGEEFKLPEQDFPLAKNLYEFVFSKKFANLGERGLFSRQLGIGINFFSEYCPDCSDMAFVKNNFGVDCSHEEILERVTLLEHNICPRCRKSKLDFILEGKLSDNWELAGMAGQRAGKSYTGATFCAYGLHRFLKLDKITEKFKVAKPTILVGTFVAVDKQQIQESSWGVLKNIIAGSPWFQNYIAMLEDQGRKIGKELVNVTKVESVEFYHKNLKLNMAAPRPGALRGRTGFMGVIDEIGWLNVRSPTEGRVITAEEVYAALNNRMGTLTASFQKNRLIHPDLPPPIFINVSSPQHSRDMICTLVKSIQQQERENFENSTLRRYWFQYPTWEINPDFPRDCSYIASKYKQNAKDAERDFGAIPPLSSNAFIENNSLIEACFILPNNTVSVNYKLLDKTQPYDVEYKVMVNSLTNINGANVSRVLTLDLGYNDNSTAITIGYHDKDSDTIKVDAIIEIIPSPGCEINFFMLVERVLKKLIVDLNVRILGSDRWQSLGILQQLAQTLGVHTITYSLQYNDFQFLKQSLVNTKILFPVVEDTKLSCTSDLNDYPFCFYKKPVSHLFFQCLTVVVETSGKESKQTLRKGDKTTDDVFRSVALLHYILNDPACKKILESSNKMAARKIGIAHVETSNGMQNMSDSNFKFSGSIAVVK